MKKSYFVSILACLVLFPACLLAGCGSAASSGGGGGGSAALTIVTIYSSTDASSSHGSVFAKGTNVYAAFATSDNYLCLARSTDEGTTFTLITKEANNINGSSSNVDLAVTDSGILYATYRWFVTGPGNDIGVSSMDADTGTSFVNRTVYSGTSFLGNGQDMSVLGNDILFSFNDDNAPRMRWSSIEVDDFKTMSDNAYDSNQSGGVACKISTATSYETVFMNTDSSNYQIIAALSSQKGKACVTVEVVPATTEVIKALDIDSTGEVLHLSYIKGDRLYAMHSPDRGASWSSEHLVNASANADRLTSIACSGNNIGIAYLSGTNGKNLCFAYSTDGGSTWTSKTLISDVDASWIDMYHADNVLYLMYRNSTGVYLVGSGDFGATWP